MVDMDIRTAAKSRKIPLFGKNVSGEARARMRGVTLIESTLFASVALGLIVVGVMFFEQADQKSRVMETSKSVTLAQAQIRRLIAGNRSESINQGDMTEFLQNAAYTTFQGDDGVDEKFTHPWGGDLNIEYYGDEVFQISLDGVTDKTCRRLATETFKGSSFNTFTLEFAFIVNSEGYSRYDIEGFDEAIAACNTAPKVEAGWIYGRTMASMSAYMADSEADPETDPEPTPEPDPETGGEEEVAGEPEPTGPEPVVIPADDLFNAYLVGSGEWNRWTGGRQNSAWIDFASAGLDFAPGMGFTITGDGNPTMNTGSSGTMLSEGTFDATASGTNIQMDAPPCGGSNTVTITLDNGSTGTFTVGREAWDDPWNPRPAHCDP